MKLKKIFAVAASCLVTAFSAILSVSATFTDTTDTAPPVTTLPALQAPPPTSGTVPSFTSAGGGAVLGNSTQTDSASTGDKGIALAVSGLLVATGIGAATVVLKNKKK